MTKIFLPWMSKELFRNRERTQHWSVRGRASKDARLTAKLIASGIKVKSGGDIRLQIVFHPPDRRRRDMDNMHGALKPSLDGVADALGIDDQRFNPVTLIRGKVIKGGEVELWIG